jgi:hypothetical protein
MSKAFPKQIDEHFDVTFSSIYRVCGCFPAMGVQKHHKKRFAKTIVSKGFNKKSTKKTTKKSKAGFPRFFLSRFLGVSRRGEVKDHQNNIEKTKTNLTSGSFFGL